MAGANPKAFWRKVNFLEIQEHGDSQADLLELFDESLSSQLALGTDQCGGGDVYVYLDDVVFTGARAGNDLESWIRENAPQSATVHVVVVAHHKFGGWKMKERLKKAGADCGKKVDWHLWSALALENRKAYRNTSDVLWPTRLPLIAEAKIIDATKGENLYCTQGVRRFLNGEYGWGGREAFMIAYVRDGSTIATRLEPYLGFPAQTASYAVEDAPTSLGPGACDAARSRHGRSFLYAHIAPPANNPGAIALWHLWVDASMIATA